MLAGIAAILAIAAFLKAGNYGHVIASNFGEGRYQGNVTRKLEVAFATRYFLARKGTADNEILVGTAALEPLGVMTDEGVIGDFKNVELFGSSNQTSIMVASEAMAVGDKVYTAAGGKVQNEPAVAGTYWRIGTVIGNPAAGDGDRVEVETHNPVKVVVIALLGNVDDEIGTLAISAAYAQAEVTALRDKTEELADDVRALAAALSSPAEVKVLSA